MTCQRCFQNHPGSVPCFGVMAPQPQPQQMRLQVTLPAELRDDLAAIKSDIAAIKAHLGITEEEES